MASATAERTRRAADPTAPEVGEDGYPVRYEEVDGELVAFSLKPYPEAERPLYWNPIYPGQEMFWRAREKNDHGFRPIIWRQRWTDGQFRPGNAWEEHVTREFLKTLPACGDNPDKWRGVNHPDGEDAEWRCQCTWHTGNWTALRDHMRHLRHQQAAGDF
jgi:hypothetical protein